MSREDNVVSASVVREVPSRNSNPTDFPIYRLRIACNVATGAGEMRLTWSPQPQTGRGMALSVDGNAPAEYEVQGKESMGNGATMQTGHASVLLSEGHDGMVLANRSMIVRQLFPGETVEFPLGELDSKARSELRRCF